jgi:hypothetical protein
MVITTELSSFEEYESMTIQLILDCFKDISSAIHEAAKDANTILVNAEFFKIMKHINTAAKNYLAKKENDLQLIKYEYISRELHDRKNTQEVPNFIIFIIFSFFSF